MINPADSPLPAKPERRFAETQPKTERLNINVSARTAAALRTLSERRETTVTDTVRRAVAVLEVLENVLDNGNVLLMKDREGGVTQLTIV